MNTVDMTPKWQKLLPLMLFTLQNTTKQESREYILKEFESMAKAADLWNQHIGSSNPDSVTPKEE